MSAKKRRVPLTTIARPVSWSGPGIHTGEACRVTVAPAETPGLRFVADGVEIPAIVDCVVDTTRCTVLGRDGASIATVEHVLAALTGLGIWSARIVVDGPELPALDGSAGPYVEGILDAGAVEIGAIDALVPPAGRIEDAGAVRAGFPAGDRPAAAFTLSGDRPAASFTLSGDRPAASFTLSGDRTAASFALSGDHPLLSGQSARIFLDDPSTFAGEIAPCRTWAPIEQVEALLARNLIRGGSLENAVVVYRDRYSSPLRRECEPARHKLLDLIGDLALVGSPIDAEIVALGGGHTLNVSAIRRIKRMVESRE